MKVRRLSEDVKHYMMVILVLGMVGLIVGRRQIGVLFLVEMFGYFLTMMKQG